jgi:hypothetical protein
MAGGWGNEIMQDEISFTILDSTLMLIATFLLTVFHPGLLFPQMANTKSTKVTEKSGSGTASANESSNEGVKTESA